MLTHLNIQGLAIIETLEIEFSKSFNVITGETGAGKSILIKALSLLLGSKASHEVIRKGWSRALVSGVFRVPVTHRACSLLNDLGIECECDGKESLILIRRQITEKGRSIAWINDVQLTLTALRSIGYVLIDVFGQHENQRLINPVEHLFYIDQFCNSKKIKREVVGLYDRCSKDLHEIENLVEDFHKKVRDRDYLSYRIEELNNFNPCQEEYDKLISLCDNASKSLEIKDKLTKAQTLIDQGASASPVSSLLWEVSRLLGSMDNKPELVEEIIEDVEIAAEKVDEISFRLGKVQMGLDIDESQIEVAQSRLSMYQDFYRKYVVNNIEELLQEKERLSKELDFIDNASITVHQRVIELRNRSLKLQNKAKLLSAERKKSAVKIRESVECQLSELNMVGASLRVDFQPVHRSFKELNFSGIDHNIQETWQEIVAILSNIGSSGLEKAQFLLSSNPGEPFLPLAKIASGGEISRIMLAIKKVLVCGAETCVLVFDEIDTGISGKTADVVGRKMRELADNFQVVCISHLAQVAAYADKHFLVEKFQKRQRTESQIVPLSKKESAKEIARLISGVEITSSSLANAKMLVTKARMGLD